MDNEPNEEDVLDLDQIADAAWSEILQGVDRVNKATKRVLVRPPREIELIAQEKDGREVVVRFTSDVLDCRRKDKAIREAQERGDV